MANIQQGMNQILGGIGQAIALNPSAREAATNRAKNKSITKKGEALAKAANEHYNNESVNARLTAQEKFLKEVEKPEGLLGKAKSEVGEDTELMDSLKKEVGTVATEYLGAIEAGRDVQSALGDLQEERLNAKPTAENINKLALQRKNAIKRAEDLYNARMLSQSYFAHNVFKKGGNTDTYDTRDK